MKWSSRLAIVLSGAALVLAWLAMPGPDRLTPVANNTDRPAVAGAAALPGGRPAQRPQDATRPEAHVAQGARILQPPPGVSADQWHQLVAEHAGRADGGAELRRLADYFQFADALQRFRQLRKSPSAGSELTALARSIDQALDARVQQREVNGAEARSIKAAVLEVLQPDESARNAALRQWQAAAAPAVPQVAEARARDAEFLRQQAALVAAWSARAPAERDQRALERDLAALKQATYAGPGAPAATPSAPRRTP